jgi:putative Holliday junction resolvase
MSGGAAPGSGFRRGVRIGVDVGSGRVGVARTDPEGRLAVPVTTLHRTRRGQDDLQSLAQLVAEYEPLEVVVGLPVTLAGEEGPAVAAVREYVGRLVACLAGRGLEVPVRLVDERLSTAAAAQGLRSAGRDTRRAREVIDQAAAVIIVQDAITTERSTGTPPGQRYRPGPPPGDAAHEGNDRR